jgi:hypothetical protein
MYLKQTDKISCGPISIYNAICKLSGQWCGFELYEEIKKLTGSGLTHVTEITNALYDIIHDDINIEHGFLYDYDDFDKNDDIVIIIYFLTPHNNMHFDLFLGTDSENIYFVNTKPIKIKDFKKFFFKSPFYYWKLE